MNPAEKQILHDALRELADKYIPLVVADLVSKIPAPYGALVQAGVSALLPALVAKLDAAIDAAV